MFNIQKNSFSAYVCVCVAVHLVNISVPVISLLVTWFLFFFFMAGCVYVTAVLRWYKHAPHSNWINVRRTAGSSFLPVTSYPCYNCVCPLMTSAICRVHTWRLRGCPHSKKNPGTREVWGINPEWTFQRALNPTHSLFILLVYLWSKQQGCLFKGGWRHREGGEGRVWIRIQGSIATPPWWSSLWLGGELTDTFGSYLF